MRWQKFWIMYLDYDDSFLNNIADASLNQIQQNLNASRGSGFDLDGGLTNRFDRFANKVDIYFRSIPERSEISRKPLPG